MKHIFVVKKGSLAIWKRLEPNDHNRELIKNASDRIETEKSLFVFLNSWFESNHFFF
jgi:hypothetical protein